MSGVKILIADDHEVVRRGIREILDTQKDWIVCGDAGSGREVIAKAKRLKPDVVILDIRMPELNGVEVTRQLVKDLPKTQILIMTIDESRETMREALSAGARGYVLKSDAGEQLVAAVQSLLKQEVFLTPKASDLALDVLRTGRETKLYPDLTPREREITQLLAEGRSSKEVAAVLGISAKTVHTHRYNIMHKLGMDSVADLVRYAIRNKITQL